MHRNRANLFQEVAIISTILTPFVGAPLLGAWIGKRVDEVLATSPIFLIILFFLGLISGGYSAFRLIKNHVGDNNS